MRAFSIALLLPCVLGLLTPTTQKQGSGTLVTLPMSIRTNKVSNIAEVRFLTLFSSYVVQLLLLG